MPISPEINLAGASTMCSYLVTMHACFCCIFKDTKRPLTADCTTRLGTWQWPLFVWPLWRKPKSKSGLRSAWQWQWQHMARVHFDGGVLGIWACFFFFFLVFVFDFASPSPSSSSPFFSSSLPPFFFAFLFSFSFFFLLSFPFSFYMIRIAH